MPYGIGGGNICVVRRCDTRQEEGFTLIEVMVVCVILGIAATLAIPNFLEWQARNQLRHVTSEVATQLTLARMSAMNRNRSVNVTLTNVGGSVRISVVTASDSVSVLDETVQSKGIVVEGSPVTVSFSSLGVKTSAGTGKQDIRVCNAQKRQYLVTIIPMGKVNWSTIPSATPCT